MFYLNKPKANPVIVAVAPNNAIPINEYRMPFTASDLFAGLFDAPASFTQLTENSPTHKIARIPIMPVTKYLPESIRVFQKSWTVAGLTTSGFPISIDTLALTGMQHNRFIQIDDAKTLKYFILSFNLTPPRL